MDCLDLAQDMSKLRDFVNMVIKVLVPKNRGTILTS
jgi:hypothetical protein